MKSKNIKMKISTSIRKVSQSALLLLLTAAFNPIIFAQSGQNWVTGGDSVSAGSFIGTTNNQPIIFKTYNTQQMILTPVGFVGIGTNSPGQMLDINGNSHVGGNLFLDGNATIGGTLNLTGAFNTSGNITANCISTACLNVSGTFMANNLTANYTVLTDTIKASRFESLDSIIHFGTSTMNFNLNEGQIYNDGIDPHFGNLFIVAPHGIGIGQQAYSWADNSVVIGGGNFTGTEPINANLQLQNNTANSLMVGFNTTIPALFVGPGNGTNNQGTIGNVGIGTTNPMVPLQINGSTSVYAKDYNGIFDGNISLFFGQENVTTGAGKWGIQYSLSGTNQQSGLNFWIPFITSGGNYFGNNYLFIADGVQKTVNMPNGGVLSPTTVTTNGYVGIGTGDPSYKLDVNGVVNAQNYLQNGQLLNSSQWTTYTAPGETFQNADIFFIPQGGKVNIGINQYDPLPGNYGLYVQSGILTTHVRVAVYGSANWADNVFDSDYKMENLTDLNKYIKKNHHLPNIPSAEEVSKDGVDVGQMDAKLLSKIEELTLYIIQMKEEINGLNKEMDKLKQAKADH